ncbi:hypothetical protein M407DRAFT_246251 [Tulasnella calospora MUT 4182]|uniref:Thioredoxin n=1 Tax=Tulasnella calospora MUT 4182 TaxID=1051891 RepID=A0A0C3Q630_9AGAM|nr:hypothetical protein M407DRAFT_246251 [Tulasnella calospora MUT 4182]
MASPWLRHINKESELNQLTDTKPVVVIDFHATWCGPCHAIAPLYSQLADQYKTVTFTKVDVDKLQSVAKKYNVTAMPTFVVVKDRQEVDRIKGADQKALRSLVQKHAPKADESSEASGSGEGGPAPSDVSLLEYLDLNQVNCLNENQDHTLKSIIGNRVRNSSAAYLESDADEQLLLTLPFNQVVRIRSIVIHTKEAQNGPKDIKLDINKPSIGFDDIEDAKEPAVVQEITVPEDFVAEGKHIHLRFVRLQRVNSLHIFVSSNHGGVDETRIDAIDVFGQPVVTMQMAGFKKTEDD